MYKGADEYETTASPKAISRTQPSPPLNYGRRSMMNQACSCIHIVMIRRDTKHETKRRISERDVATTSDVQHNVRHVIRAELSTKDSKR
jgi:hypothetical protein